MSFWDRFRRVHAAILPKFKHGSVYYGTITPDEVRQIRARLAEDEALKLLIECCESYDGYIRQAALQELFHLPSPNAIPSVLIRLADWVPQVREEAWNTLQHLLDLGYVHGLVDSYVTLKALNGKQRVDLRAQLNALNERMLQKNAVQSLIDGLDSGKVTKRRFCLETMAQESCFHPLVIDRSCRDPDPSIRRWLARGIISGRFQASDALKIKLMHDPAPIVSTTILRSLTEKEASALDSHLIELATYPAAPTRASAQFWIRKLKIQGVLHSARRELDDTASTQPRPGVIAALSELGNAEQDLCRVSPLCAHPRSAVRFAALEAFARLTRDEQGIDTLINAIRDSNGKIRNAVTRALASRPRPYWIEQVQDIFLDPESLATVPAWRLLTQSPDWSMIPVMLRALSTDNAPNHELAFEAISIWHKRYSMRGWLRPDLKTQQQILSTWSKVKQLQPPKSYDVAWNHLKQTIHEGADQGWAK